MYINCNNKIAGYKRRAEILTINAVWQDSRSNTTQLERRDYGLSELNFMTKLTVNVNFVIEHSSTQRNVNAHLKLSGRKLNGTLRQVITRTQSFERSMLLNSPALRN